MGGRFLEARLGKMDADMSYGRLLETLREA